MRKVGESTLLLYWIPTHVEKREILVQSPSQMRVALLARKSFACLRDTLIETSDVVRNMTLDGTRCGIGTSNPEH